MAVPVTSSATLRFGAPIELFSVPTVGTGRGYSVARNGQRFLIPTPGTEGPPAPITVTTNWVPAALVPKP